MTVAVLSLETVDHVRILSLNRPARHNALDHELQEALWSAYAEVIAAPEVRAVLLRGEGPSFCSGFDTAELGQHGDDGTYALGLRVQDHALRRINFPKPVVAAVHGYALGVGLELALAADVRVAASDAQLGFPEVLYGLCTDNGGAALSAVLANPSRAKYLLMSGEPIDAETALAWGLVDFVVDPADLDAHAMRIASSFAKRSPIAVHAAKHLVDVVHRAAVTEGTRQELLAILALYGTQDRHEARAARAQERDPLFHGR